MTVSPDSVTCHRLARRAVVLTAVVVALLAITAATGGAAPLPESHATAEANATLSATGGSTTPGGTVGLSYTVTNTGSSPAGFLLAVTKLPDGATVVDHTDDGGTFSPKQQKWAFPTIGVGQSKSVSVVLRISNGSAGTYNTSAAVTSLAGVQATTTTTVTVTAAQKPEQSPGDDGSGGGLGGAGTLPPPPSNEADSTTPRSAEENDTATEDTTASGDTSGDTSDASTATRTVVYDNGTESSEETGAASDPTGAQPPASGSPGFGLLLTIGAVLCVAWLGRRVDRPD